jgi:hypothetical protein
MVGPRAALTGQVSLEFGQAFVQTTFVALELSAQTIDLLGRDMDARAAECQGALGGDILELLFDARDELGEFVGSELRESACDAESIRDGRARSLMVARR